MKNISFNIAEPTKFPEDKVGRIIAVIDDNDTIKYKKQSYPISDMNKSIKGLKVFYTIPKEHYSSLLSYHKSEIDVDSLKKAHISEKKYKEDFVCKIIQSREYLGENEMYRPYRKGLEVVGKLIQGIFYIFKIKHLEGNLQDGF